jgi:hypothetical protein
MCDLSHDANPHRVPACLHFLRGNCSNDTCRYAHIKVNPSAPVCRDFAVLGYCEKGATCIERHVHECPDYANSGSCPRKKCNLPHVDRAGQLRKAVQPANQNSDETMTVSTKDLDSDLSSDENEEYDSEDVDSDAVDEELIEDNPHANNTEISDQDSFIHF